MKDKKTGEMIKKMWKEFKSDLEWLKGEVKVLNKAVKMLDTSRKEKNWDKMVWLSYDVIDVVDSLIYWAIKVKRSAEILNFLLDEMEGDDK